MDIVRWCISRPVTVAVGVFLVLMFGIIGAREIPVQLTPTVSRPTISVTTIWPGRSPEEVIDEITKEQEEKLKNVENLDRMVSSTEQGQTVITLDFNVGSNITRALQEVSDALRQVSSYPAEVEEPTVVAADGVSDVGSAIAWFIVDFDNEAINKHSDFDLTTIFDDLDREVKPYLERVEGVATVNIFGGREREARVMADPVALAQRGLNHIDVVNALSGENQNVSAGTIAEGKRDYRVRLVGQFSDPEQILETIVAYRDGRPVYVRDVAMVEVGHEKERGFVRSFARPAIAMNIIRQSDSNVLDIMEELKVRMEDVRTTILPNVTGESSAGPIGPDLRLRQVYDETLYITSAISLVTQNLWVGGGIATMVLLLFLRNWRATGIIAIALPVSVIGTFLILLALGRSLNVVSLAGLAFAVGMVVDNSIVVLENIDRRLKLGEKPRVAAWRGGKEVWGAVLASTLTTIAVFVPVLTIQEEVGQLFRDISIAIVGAVSFSLIVSVMVIPTACSRWLKADADHDGIVKRILGGMFGLTALFNKLILVLGSALRWSMTGVAGWTVRPAVILVMTGVSVAGTLMMMPPMDYLPAGNRNLVFGGMLIPPGLSVDARKSMANKIEEKVYPYAIADIDDPLTMADLDTIQMIPGVTPEFAPMPIGNFFIGTSGSGLFIGATSQDDQVVIPVGHLLSSAMSGIPDSFGGARQSSLFRGLGSGGGISVEIAGPDLDRVNAAAAMMFGTGGAEFGYTNVSPSPSNFTLEEQEMQLVLNDRGRELGLTTQGLGVAIRGLFDGAFVGDYKVGSETIDLVVLPMGGRMDTLEQIRDVPISTPAGPVVPVDSVVDFVPSLAAQEIQRIEELPSVTITVNPPETMAVAEAMAWIQENMIDGARNAGLIDRTMRVRLEGSAADLEQVRASLLGASVDGVGAGSRLSIMSAIAITMLSILGAGVVYIRGVKAKNPYVYYGVAGTLLLGLILSSLAWIAIAHPELMTARLIWALMVTYLLMCALFESFLYPLVIMFSVPLAVVGGFGGLAIVHAVSMADPTKAPQKLDVLTMLGFVILIGVVVNNAILLVHQALNFMRGDDADTEHSEPMGVVDAIVMSVQTRIRPIFMSVLTSVGGMLPLVLVPGSGSEMYRGLGSVVIGGLVVSTVFTLVLVPMLFSLVMDMRRGALVDSEVVRFDSADPFAA
jgi:hydrophobic/amphiphilic exporter-1 (mainly G- bacteria), HAE1 family